MKAATQDLRWDWDRVEAEEAAFQAAPTYLEGLKAAGHRPATQQEFDAVFGRLPVDHDD